MKRKVHFVSFFSDLKNIPSIIIFGIRVLPDKFSNRKVLYKT